MHSIPFGGINQLHIHVHVASAHTVQKFGQVDIPFSVLIDCAVIFVYNCDLEECSSLYMVPYSQ